MKASKILFSQQPGRVEILAGQRQKSGRWSGRQAQPDIDGLAILQ